MICEINVVNAALLRSAKLAFDGGFCAVTGETGAGKSVFVTALGLLCGEKTPAGFVSKGENECKVTALFDGISPELSKKLEEMGLGDGESCVSLGRRITSDGRSRCFVNSEAVSLAVLRSVGAELLHMHSQHKTHSLADSQNHCGYVDGLGDGDHLLLLENYEKEYERYCELKKKLEDTRRTVSEGRMKKDYLRTLVKELSAANVKHDEEDRLWEKYRLLENSGKLSAAAQYVRTAVNGSEKQKGARERIILASAKLAALGDVGESISRLSQRFEQLGFELEALMEELDGICPDDGDSNEKLMEKISDRINLIRRLKKKYSCNEKELIELLESSKEEFELINDSANAIGRLEKQLEEQKKLALTVAGKLEASRMALGGILEREVKARLEFLDMEKALFLVKFIPEEELCPQGRSRVSFYIRTNEGEDACPLGNIASGGELGRVMLALKSALATKKESATLIFDEIDTGISGKTSRKIGILLSEMAKTNQIIAVTHSAQIASLASEHYKLEKAFDGENTVSSARKLGRAERIEELSRILGGINVTETARQNAIELLDDRE